jgi:hypothetical protein
MFYSAAGLLLSLAIAVAAWLRSGRRGGPYDAGVYAMDRRAHLRYAAISVAFAMFFAFALALRLEAAGIGALALYALIAVFYVTSFLRGAFGPDE